MREGKALLIASGTVVPMTEEGLFFTGDVLILGNRIVAVGTNLPRPPECEVLDAQGCLVLPGFVQTHVHVVQSLARHRAEGLTLLQWLTTRIWPYEAALGKEEVAAAARLGIAELLTGGTTTALDMGTVHHHHQVFLAAAQLGIRFISGKCHMDRGEGVPEALLEDRESSLAEAAHLATCWHGAEGGRLRYAVAPRFALSCSPELLTDCVELARSRGLLLHTHASENWEETKLVRAITGKGNVAYLADLGVAGSDTVLAHCVHVEDSEVASMAKRGTGVAHCPGANLKLGSGIADVPKFLAAGVKVGLGADGPPCNNRLSIFHEMALAGTLHNLRHPPGCLTPWRVLELATWRGAEVVGWGGELGRLKPGFLADVVVLAPSWSFEPWGDPASMVVFGAGVEAVRHVVVDGRPVVVEGHLTTANAHEVRQEARSAAASLKQRLPWL
ncbi:MAG: amidohydrolase family protein [Thermoanaerobaculum sp.]|nr:amidohydrolase family protein [Thermoanaerobaculum sp.]MDW7967370.1 amidohydrolase family protein [Thermoanaerobaculum sp.]